MCHNRGNKVYFRVLFLPNIQNQREKILRILEEELRSVLFFLKKKVYLKIKSDGKFKKTNRKQKKDLVK